MKGKQSIIVTIVLAVAALAVLLTYMSDSPHNVRQVVASVSSPASGENAMQAKVTSGRTRGSDADATEVVVTGKWRGTRVDTLVLHSANTQPDMLHVGWSGPAALVIAVPQVAGDAGRALGDGDASFRCGSSGVLQVRCETYTVAPVPERHPEPAPSTPPPSLNR